MNNDASPEISSFEKLYEKLTSPDDLISPIISGHLVIEFLLKKIISIYDPVLESLSERLTHKKLIELAYEKILIDQNKKDTLIIINKLRNKFAHEITYQLNLLELKELFLNAMNSFSDLTDGISQGLDAISTANSVSELDGWVILELFVQISYDLHEIYISIGGDEVLFH